MLFFFQDVGSFALIREAQDALLFLSSLILDTIHAYDVWENSTVSRA